MTAVEDSNRERASTFVVSSADETATVLQDVETAQVHTVSSADVEPALPEKVPDSAIQPGTGLLEPGAVLEETMLSPATDGVRSTIERVGTVRWIPIECVDLEPTKRSRETAREAAVGELTTHERAGEGTLHVLAVPPEQLESAATDVLEDLATRSRGARLGIDRVEIRTGTTGTGETAAESGDQVDVTGVLSVRYLPN